MLVSPTIVHRPPGPSAPIKPRADVATLSDLLRLKDQYGNTTCLTTPRGRNVYFVNEPELLQRILVRDQGKYVKGPGFERVKLLLGNGIFVSDGSHWRRARTMAQPGFTRRKLRHLIDLIVRSVDRQAERWVQLAERNEMLDVTTETSDFALELILRAIFGRDYDDKIVADGDNPFAFLSKEFTRDIGLVVRFRALRDLIFGVIDDRRRSDSENDYDFLSVYMSAVDKSGCPFTNRELLDEVMTLIVAGFETSAGTLNWAWHLITVHPDVEKRIVDEAVTVFGEASVIEREKIGELQYLERVLNETMRLYPPGWIFSRRAIEDHRIGDFDVPAGTDIYISPFILHRSAEFWPDPETFDPDRFSPERFDEKCKAAFIPFSLGPRRCIGEYFAMLEMKIHLARLVRRFHMRPESAETPELDLGINLRSKNGIRLRAEVRG